MAQWSDEFLPLGRAYHWEKARAHETYLVQPMADGSVRSWTWQQAMDEARRIATFLRSRGWEPGVRIATLARNSAWWMIAELGAWMAGLRHRAALPFAARGIHPRPPAARRRARLFPRRHG